MAGRYVAWLVVGLVLLAGCSASAQPAERPSRNATLALAGYDRVAAGSTAETRTFWDRSTTWEDPGTRNATVISHARAYRATNGTATVAVYTTPKEPYVGADRIRTRSAPALAALATRPVAGAVRVPDAGAGPTYRATVLGKRTTVRTLADGGAEPAHVTRAVRDDVIVVAVVTNATDRATVEGVLEGITIYNGSR